MTSMLFGCDVVSIVKGRFFKQRVLALRAFETWIHSCTVRPRDTRPQAARTLQMHVFELGPKLFELNEFM